MLSEGASLYWCKIANALIEPGSVPICRLPVSDGVWFLLVISTRFCRDEGEPIRGSLHSGAQSAPSVEMTRLGWIGRETIRGSLCCGAKRGPSTLLRIEMTRLGWVLLDIPTRFCRCDGEPIRGSLHCGAKSAPSVEMTAFGVEWKRNNSRVSLLRRKARSFDVPQHRDDKVGLGFA